MCARDSRHTCEARCIYTYTNTGVLRVTMLYLSFSGPCLKTQGWSPTSKILLPFVYGFRILETLDDRSLSVVIECNGECLTTWPTLLLSDLHAHIASTGSYDTSSYCSIRSAGRRNSSWHLQVACLHLKCWTIYLLSARYAKRISTCLPMVDCVWLSYE